MLFCVNNPEFLYSANFGPGLLTSVFRITYISVRPYFPTLAVGDVYAFLRNQIKYSDTGLCNGTDYIKQNHYIKSAPYSRQPVHLSLCCSL